MGIQVVKSRNHFQICVLIDTIPSNQAEAKNSDTPLSRHLINIDKRDIFFVVSIVLAFIITLENAKTPVNPRQVSCRQA